MMVKQALVAETERIKTEDRPSHYVQPSRRDKVPITGHFHEYVRRGLHEIAEAEGTTIQALIASGIQTIFNERARAEGIQMLLDGALSPQRPPVPTTAPKARY